MTRETPLRQQAYHTLLQQIVEGELPAETRIVESQLAAELGISRTPLREALIRLSNEGFVVSDLNRGFSVAPLTTREVRELYPVLWTLEGLAVQQTGAAVAEAAAELEGINSELQAAAEDPESALMCDTRFHERLIAGCPNRKLLGMLKDLRRAIERYERIYMRGGALIEHSLAQHREIIRALQQQNPEEAAVNVEKNWRFGMNALLRELGELA